MRTHQLVAALASAALLLGTAACGGDSPKPPALTSTPNTPTPTPTPTPTNGGLPDFTKWQDEPADIPVPQMPATAKDHTKAGAVAFGKHYMALVNYTLLTGESGPILALGSKGCEPCKSVVDSLVKTLANDGAYLGDPRYGSSSFETSDISESDAGVSIETRSGAIKGRSKAGKVESIPADHVGLVLRLKVVKDSWIITDLTIGTL